ncbi:rhomboid family intramembrane serine protease [Dokdonia ponticola]|uniref:Rhomboid family intramembrane serine protease n=1 Tax=Dokdonia ponticola TaxID=2041041 RepID=A0ABV9I3U8_9FLAO
MAANSLSYQFKTANIAIKLIVINFAVFILLNLIPTLFGVNFSFIGWFTLPDNFPGFLTQPWSIITYAFLHGGIFHILFNMYFLYIFSRFILNLFTEKRFLTLYLLGGMAGGVLYMLSYSIFPALIAKSGGFLLGASAAVMALIVFIATYSPQTGIRFFIFDFKLWQIATFYVVFDLMRVSLGTDNMGGLISHLGGAAFGYVYAMQLAKGNDIGAWFEKGMDTVASWFSSKSKSKKTNMRTVHRTAKKTATKNTKAKQSSVTKSDQQQQIDAILDKISKSGYDSLSKAEKDFLFKAGKDN